MKMRAMVASVLLVALVASLALPSWSGNARSVRKQVESSVRLSGTVVIGSDGTVQAHELEPGAQLTPKIEDFIARSLATWRFEPVKVNGEVVRARVPMSLRLVAKREGDEGNFNVRIASAHFGSENPAAESDWLTKAELQPPHYPAAAARLGASGIAYLIVRVGPDGRVMNVAAEQVNLFVLGSSEQVKAIREEFADAGIRAARKWTFRPPTTGPYVDHDSWLVRVPVEFRMVGDRRPKPGEWEAYVAGPRNMDMPWAHEQLKTAGSPDALPDAGVYPLRQGATLLTPLG